MQNAEENEYEGVEPKVEIFMTNKNRTGTGAPATLLVFHNEVGFSRENMDSICSICHSTKKGKRQQRFTGENAEEYRNEATMREERIRVEAAEREQRFTAEMEKFRREQMTIMQENAKMVEQRAAIQLGRWMKEAGFSGIDTATQGNIEPMSQVASTQPQNIHVVQTPGMDDAYHPEISASIQDTQEN